jgi:endonuclease III
MGAVVCDAGLQAGVRYETVVRPRIERLIAAWPEPTLSTFEAHIAEPAALEGVLQFRGRKLDTIRQLTSHLRSEEIDTVHGFSSWLDLPSNATSLFEIKGIKDKTVDYLRMLVGLPGAAVDQHLRRFVQRAWPEAATYAEVHDLMVRAAEAGGHDLGGLEHAIWNYESRQLRSAATPSALDPVDDLTVSARSLG